jgi:ubiquinone/menaquinone biosynthesis C-methylase UbiE
MRNRASGGRGGATPALSTPDRIVDFFDRRAVDYDREYGRDTPAGYALRTRRQKVLDLFDQSGRTVLDVGCGPGVMAAELLARGCRFYGIDPSEQTISIARHRFADREDARFVRGDAGTLPFADNFFDAVLCMGVIDSVPDASNAIAEMMRVLKPGGTLIVTGANLMSPYAWWKNFAYYPLLGVWHRFRARLGDPTLAATQARIVPRRRLYSRRTAEELVVSHRGQVTDVVPCHFNVFLSPLDEMLPRASLRITRRMEEGTWRWPGWIAAVWIVRAKKL